MQRFLPFALVLAIGAACGFGVGYMFGLSSGEEMARPRFQPDVSPDEPASPLTPESPDEIDGVTELADVAPLPTGDERFSGVVLDFHGEPLAGVAVVARLSTPEAPADSPAADLDRAAYLREQTQRFEERRAGWGRANTDDQGRFTISGLPAGRYVVTASLDDYELSRDFKNPVEPGRFLSFSAHRVYPVRLRVLLPDGSVPAHATIEQKRGSIWGSASNLDWTPEDPVIRLRVQHYWLTARQGTLRSDQQEVTVSPSQMTHTITLELVERNGIRGRVVTSGDEVIEYVSVRHVWAEKAGDSADGSPHDALLKSHLHRYASVATGVFEITGIEPGTYLIGAGWSKSRIDVSTRIEVDDGLVEVELELPPLTDGDGIPVWVYDSTGAIAHTGVSFQVGYMMPATAPKKPHRQETWIRGVRRRDGSHLLLLDDPLGKALDERDDVELVVHHQNMRRTAPISRATRRLTVRFDDSARFRLRVAGLPTGEGRKQVSFRLVNQEQGANYYCKGPDDEDTYKCGPMQPDDYDLVMWISGRRQDLGSLTLGPGENHHSVEVPELHTLTVVLTETDSSRVYLRPVAVPGSYPRRANNKHGRAHYGALLPGEYVLTLNRNGIGGHMNLTIPGDAEVVFEASPFNALRILIEDLQGGMARAGLEDGDLVRGMYDAEFEALEQVFTLYTLLKTSEEIPLIIERHGERRTIKVQAEPLRQQSEWGGDWIPTFVE